MRKLVSLSSTFAPMNPQGANAMTDDKLAVTQEDRDTARDIINALHLGLPGIAEMVAQARLAGERAGMERAAGIAKAHQPDRIKKGQKLSHYDPEDREIIRAEENGEAIAADIISAAILKEAASITQTPTPEPSNG